MGALEVVVAFVTWAVIGVIALVVIMVPFHVKKLTQLPPLWHLVGLALALAAMIPAALLAALITGRRMGHLISVAGQMRWRWLGRCMLVAFGVHLIGFGLWFAIDAIATSGEFHQDWTGWSVFLPRALVVLLLIPLQATGEELFFRGTIVQMVGGWVRWPWVAIVISGVTFGLGHGLDVRVDVAMVATGLVFAWLAVRTGGLEASIAPHVANNVLAFTSMAATIPGSWTRVNASPSWAGTIANIAMSLAYGAIITREVRRSQTDAPSA